jgi:uncharacterized membrane protein YozB (DUF420 family)
MRKLAVSVLVLVVAAAVVLDPYSFHRNASDAVSPGPLWQRAMSLLGLVILLAVLAFTWRGRYRVASTAAVVEFLLNVAVCVILLQRDGLDRFRLGFGAEEYASFYLGSLAIRVVLLRILTDFVVSPTLEASASAQ